MYRLVLEYFVDSQESDVHDRWVWDETVGNAVGLLALCSGSLIKLTSGSRRA
jgi:hypothetical protein